MKRSEPFDFLYFGRKVIVNFFLALELEARDWFLGKIVAAATLVLSVLIFIAFAAIISVN